MSKPHGAPGIDELSYKIYKIILDISNLNKDPRLHLPVNPKAESILKNIFDSIMTIEKKLRRNLTLSNNEKALYKQNLLYFIYKKNDIHDLNNYRNIGLINTCRKLHQKIFKHKFENALSSKHIISKNQYGFTSKKSCLQPTALVSNKIKYAKGNSKPLYMMTLDLKQAFDSVDMNVVDFYLKQLHLNKRSRNMLKNSIDETVIIPTAINKNASPVVQKKGSTQGAIISPTVFKILINILLKYLERKYKFLDIYAFADDLIIMVKSKTQLNKVLRKLMHILNVIKLELNTSKSKIFIVNETYASKQKALSLHPSDVINQFEVVNGYTKYLGMMINKNGWHLENNKLILQRVKNNVNKLRYQMFGGYKWKNAIKVYVNSLFTHLIGPIVFNYKQLQEYDRRVLVGFNMKHYNYYEASSKLMLYYKPYLPTLHYTKILLKRLSVLLNGVTRKIVQKNMRDSQALAIPISTDYTLLGQLIYISKEYNISIEIKQSGCTQFPERISFTIRNLKAHQVILDRLYKKGVTMVKHIFDDNKLFKIPCRNLFDKKLEARGNSFLNMVKSKICLANSDRIQSRKEHLLISYKINFLRVNKVNLYQNREEIIVVRKEHNSDPLKKAVMKGYYTDQLFNQILSIKNKEILLRDIDWNWSLSNIGKKDGIKQLEKFFISVLSDQIKLHDSLMTEDNHRVRFNEDILSYDDRRKLSCELCNEQNSFTPIHILNRCLSKYCKH